MSSEREGDMKDVVEYMTPNGPCLLSKADFEGLLAENERLRSALEGLALAAQGVSDNLWKPTEALKLPVFLLIHPQWTDALKQALAVSREVLLGEGDQDAIR